MKSLFSSKQPRFSKAEWISILSISTVWFFNDMRSTAIKHLSPTLRSLKSSNQNVEFPIEFVLLARKYKVSWWLTKAYHTLVQVITGHRPLTLQEAEKMGRDTAHELQALALRRLHLQIEAPESANRPRISVELEIVPLFRTELTALREEEQRYGPGSHVPGPVTDDDASLSDAYQSAESATDDELPRPPQPPLAVTGMSGRAVWLRGTGPSCSGVEGQARGTSSPKHGKGRNSGRDASWSSSRVPDKKVYGWGLSAGY
jgi:hypothetical protein